MATKPFSAKRTIKWLWTSPVSSVEHARPMVEVCFESPVKFVNAMLLSRKTSSICIVALCKSLYEVFKKHLVLSGRKLSGK